LRDFFLDTYSRSAKQASGKMKLAFCIFKYYPFGGLERNFLRITEECLRRGHAVTIYTMSWEGDIPEVFTEKNCKIIKVPFSGVSNHARCASYVKNLSSSMVRSDYDLVVGFNRMPGLDLYYCADVCFKADIQKRHSFIYRCTPRYKTYLEFEKSVFGADSETHILALSEIQREIYMREYQTQTERFHSVPAGIDKDRIRSWTSALKRDEARSELNIGENENMLLMVGSDFRRKGVVRSIDAVASLPGDLKSKTKLFVIGKGKSDRLKRRADRCGVNIIFTGTVNNVQKYLSAADLLLHPAVSENTGNAIVEALISGTPVIATSNCGYAFHVVNADAGRVIDGVNYIQAEFDTALKEFLEEMPEKSGYWSECAVKYSDITDFYSRPAAITDIIEELGSGRI
jgi:UDP-glucose:(heptosyl)LPS alpha-1,3-glucosyltransferase